MQIVDSLQGFEEALGGGVAEEEDPGSASLTDHGTKPLRNLTVADRPGRRRFSNERPGTEAAKRFRFQHQHPYQSGPVALPPES